MKLQNPILLAVIGAAQGIKGEVRVKSYTQTPEGFAGYGLLYDASGRSFEVLSTRVAKEIVVTRFKGLQDRNAAEALTGTQLFVERALLKKVAEDDDEFLHADLIGMTVLDREGQTYGNVLSVLNFGAGDILDVSPGHGPSIAIPFTKAAVPHIDLGARTITIDAVAAGLVEDEDDEVARLLELNADQDGGQSGPKESGGNR
jgi:16S rRNA processing protein RimM